MPAQSKDDGLFAAVMSMAQDLATVKATLPAMQSDISEIRVAVDKKLCNIEDRVRVNEEWRLRAEGSLGLAKWAVGGGLLGAVSLLIMLAKLVTGAV